MPAGPTAMESVAKVNETDQHQQLSVYSRGSTYSGGNRLYTRGNMTTQWRQLYLSRAKLKAVSRTSALIAGFAMVAMVEVQLDRDAKYNPILLIMFSTVTTCLVAVHLFALMISTCMLPNIEAVSNIHHAKAIEQSPHHRMRTYIEVAWILSTGFGLILFMIEIALLIWLKFITLRPTTDTSPNANATSTAIIYTNHDAPAWVATAVLIPVVIVFALFAVHFYRTLAQHKYTMFEDAFAELETMARTGDELSQLHPNSMFVDGNYHPAVSRVHSGISVQSQPVADLRLVPPEQEIMVPSRGSSLSGHFSVDHV